MIKDLRNLIFLYIDADEYYLLKKAYKLSVKFYCKNVDMILTRREKSYLHFAKYWDSKDPIIWASYCGYLGIVKFICKPRTSATIRAMHRASCNGHLRTVKFLHQTGGAPSILGAMNQASEMGYLNVVKFLYKIGATCTEYAMDLASNFGHLKVVKFLYKINAHCTKSAIDGASCNGHFKVVKFLCKIGKPFTAQAIYKARQNGHYEVVKHLEKNYKNMIKDSTP